MADRADSDTETAGGFCLSGEVAGVLRSYLLECGDNRIGSLDTNEVVLPVFGVSREHAVIRSSGDELVVEDLGSKNGTFVNGTRVRRHVLSVGDRVCFGSTELTIEPLPFDDVVLAIAVDEPVARGEDRPLYEETGTVASAGEGCGCAARLGLLEQALARLTSQPDGDPAGALALLAGELGASRSCLVEWAASGEPLHVAGSCDVDAETLSPKLRVLVREAARAGRCCEGWTIGPLGAAGLSCAVLSSPGHPPLAVVLDVAQEAVAGLEAVLRPLLRVIAFLRGRELRSEHESPAGEAPQLRFPYGYVIAESAVMISLYAQMRPLLRGRVPVLLVGETGVGKEHLARALHASSDLADGPFVAVNCAAIPSDLLEAEMFGIGKGVATGVNERLGKFQQAQGGTLFLDEIGELPLSLQAKLLRALQEQEVRPVGGVAVSLDLRVITATNRDLLQPVEEGGFRRDLYYRIAGYVLQVPPLRSRTEDIPALVEHFLRLYARETDKRVRGVSVGALAALTRYSWPGNVRELANEVRRLVYLCADGQAVTSTLIAEQILEDAGEQLPVTEGIDLELKPAVTRLEYRLVRRALARSGGNRSEAARLLGITRNGLAIKMKRLGIET